MDVIVCMSTVSCAITHWNLAEDISTKTRICLFQAASVMKGNTLDPKLL